MAGDRYHITEQNDVHFLTFTVVEWIDIFTRGIYKNIIVNSLNYCIKEKGLECFAWVLMTNHLHLVVRANAPAKLSDVIRDFKKFTSKEIIQTIQTTNESRKEWLLHKFEFAAQSTGRAEYYKVWQDSNHAINMKGRADMQQQRINYIHLNPVRQQIVLQAEAYLHSSAGDYCGRKGLVNVSLAY